MPHHSAKSHILQQPTIGRLAAAGWNTAWALEKSSAANCIFGREDKFEVAMLDRLRSVVVLCHRAHPPPAIQTAIHELTRNSMLPRLMSGQVKLEGCNG